MLDQPITRDLDSPVYVTAWPDNSRILVVVERGSGKITWWALDALDKSPRTILDLANYTGVNPPGFGDVYLPTSFLDFVGVTAIAFDPDFRIGQRFVYVRYNERTLDAQGNTVGVTTHVVRWEIPAGMEEVSTASMTPLGSWPTTATGHGSGTLHFDTRGNMGQKTLYIPMPDDAEANPQGASNTCCMMARAQNLPYFGTLGYLPYWGRLLAMDVSVSPPIVTVEAQGLRNSFGFSVDRGQATTGAGRGNVWLADTGYQDTGSIIRWMPSPTGPIENYGWPWRQVNGQIPWMGQPEVQDGPCRFDPNGCPEPIPPPVYTNAYVGFSDRDVYGPGGGRDALVGSIVYRGSGVPSLTDRLIVATYGVGRSPEVLSLDAAWSGTGPFPAPSNLSTALGMSSWGNSNWTIHGLGQDHAGTILIARVNEMGGAQVANGAIYSIN